MAIEELEAVAFRPGDIAGHRFAMEQRGYEPEEVHRFLHLIAEYVGRLQGQVEWQRTRVEYLEQRGVSAQDSAYERLSREFMEVVRRADEAAAEVRMKAEGEARAVLDKACCSVHQRERRSRAGWAARARRRRRAAPGHRGARARGLRGAQPGVRGIAVRPVRRRRLNPLRSRRPPRWVVRARR